MSVDLSHHGDADLVPGAIDLAVNVRSGGPPTWLVEQVRAADLAGYPDPAPARAAVARRHHRSVAEVLLTAGAAEAFVLIARAFSPQHAVVVHPQFTEPEAALRAAGHRVERVTLSYPFTLDPAQVPEDADLVVIGNPTNPTSVAHPRALLRELVRPGRLVVVDEAFADCVPGEPDSLASGDLTGLVVIRSLTKTWALAGLRIGYLLAEPGLINLIRQAQSLWAVSSPALVAAAATASDAALAEVATWSSGLVRERDHLLQRLAELSSIRVVANPAGSFVLIDTERTGVRTALLDQGFAVRRGETFPGLGPTWVRVAVRDRRTTDDFIAALSKVIGDG